MEDHECELQLLHASELVCHALSSHTDSFVWQAGVSGQRTEVMVPRLERILKENPNTFTHIVILAGTNNLWNTGTAPT